MQRGTVCKDSTSASQFPPSPMCVWHGHPRFQVYLELRHGSATLTLGSWSHQPSAAPIVLDSCRRDTFGRGMVTGSWHSQAARSQLRRPGKQIIPLTQLTRATCKHPHCHQFTWDLVFASPTRWFGRLGRDARATLPRIQGGTWAEAGLPGSLAPRKTKAKKNKQGIWPAYATEGLYCMCTKRNNQPKQSRTADFNMPSTW